MIPNKKLLIVGALGFIGRAVIRHFNSLGLDVYGVDRLPESYSTGTGLLKYQKVDLPDPSFKSLLAEWQPDALIHCAGRASVQDAVKDPRSDFYDGSVLTFELLDAVRQACPGCSFLFLSSAAVYGDPPSLPVTEETPIRPLSAYGYHKWQSEILCSEFVHAYGLRAACARIFSAYGMGLRRQVVWDITRKALLGSEVVLQGTGHESRDFIHVNDIASGLNIILENAPMQAECYNLASGVETTIAELSTLISGHMKVSPQITFDGILPSGTPKNWRADISAISKLGFEPRIDMSQGVQEFVNWAVKEVSDLPAGDKK
jgi:UDP-glucose 4-epimerase